MRSRPLVAAAPPLLQDLTQEVRLGRSDVQWGGLIGLLGLVRLHKENRCPCANFQLYSGPAHRWYADGSGSEALSQAGRPRDLGGAYLRRYRTSRRNVVLVLRPLGGKLLLSSLDVVVIVKGSGCG